MQRISKHYIAAIFVVLTLGFGVCNTSAQSDGDDMSFENYLESMDLMSPDGIEALLADLTITSLSAPATASQGTTISVIHTTQNIGAAFAGSSTSKFYLCTNDVAYASGYRNQQTVGALAMGASKTLTNTTFSVPADQPLGTNYVIVICGIGLTESDKTNNTNSIPIVITQ